LRFRSFDYFCGYSELLEKTTEMKLSHLFTLLMLAFALNAWSQDVQPYRNFALRDTSGVTRQLRDFVVPGRCLVVDFWASWCSPCIRASRCLRDAFEKYHSRGLDIVGVSLDRDSVEWREAIADFHLDWPQLSDFRCWQSTAVRAYGIESVPYVLLIGRQGELVYEGAFGTCFEHKLELLFENDTICM